MTSNWPKVSRGPLCTKIGSGATPRGGKDSYKVEGIALIRSQNVYNDGFKVDGLAFIDEEQASKLDNVTVQRNDILLNITGDSVARSCSVPDTVLPARVNQHVAIIRPNPQKLSPHFVRYVLISPDMQNQLLLLASAGATRNALTKGMIEDLVIPQPAISEQQAIADILGALDDKIEINRKMNATLDELARTLFRSWFVDFDPVRAKLENREPFGMDAEIAALFPNRLVETEIGSIPEGWQVKNLGEVSTELRRGISPKYVEDYGVLVLNQKCIRGGRVDLEKARRHDPSKRSIVGRELQSGDVLINSTGVGTLGRIAQLLHLSESTICDSHVTVVRADEEIITANVLGIGLGLREAEIEGLGHGSTGQTELSRASLADLRIVIPPEIIQEGFDSLTIPLRSMSSTNENESRTLADLRDTLLPELISGRIRVPEAERAVAEVV